MSGKNTLLRGEFLGQVSGVLQVPALYHSFCEETGGSIMDMDNKSSPISTLAEGTATGG